MVPSHWSIDSGCDYWSSVHSPQKPCDLLQILLPCFLQAVNTDWSLKLKNNHSDFVFHFSTLGTSLVLLLGSKIGFAIYFFFTLFNCFNCFYLFISLIFFLMIWWLSVLLSISTLNQTLRSSQKRRWPPTKQALNCYW